MSIETIENENGYSINIDYDDMCVSDIVGDLGGDGYFLKSGYGGAFSIYEYGTNNEAKSYELLPEITEKHIRDNATELVKIILDEYFDGEYSSLLSAMRGEQHSSGTVDFIRDCLIDYIDSLGMSDIPKAVSNICDIIGIPCEYCDCSQSQGDYSIFIRIGGDYIESDCGIVKKALQEGIYWYEVIDTSGEVIGSCGGFIGYDYEQNGLLEHANNDIECHIEELQKAFSA